MFREGFTPPHENNQNGAVLDSGSDKFKIARVDVGCGYGEKTGEVDHYPAGTLDTYDSAFNAFERTVQNTDFLAGLKLGRDILEIEGFVGHDSADLHEVGHCLVGDDDGFACRLVPEEGGVAAFAHGFEDFAKCGLGGTDETEVRDGRDRYIHPFAVLLDLPGTHRNKVLHTVFSKAGAELQHPSIGHPYCIPMYLQRWRWADSNRRPNTAPESFLHA